MYIVAKQGVVDMHCLVTDECHFIQTLNSNPTSLLYTYAG